MKKKKKKSNKIYKIVVLLFSCSIILLLVLLVNLVILKVQINDANTKYNEILEVTDQYRNKLSDIQAQIDKQ